MSSSSAWQVDAGEVLDCAIAALNQNGADLPTEAVDRALMASPYDYRLWHVKGLMLRDLNQREHAIPALRRAAELAPDEPLIAHGYARTLLEAGLPCVEQFARALKLEPHNSDLIKGLASALVADRRMSDAIDGLRSVLGRSPLWTDGHILLSHLLWLDGEKAQFTRSFDEAILTNPNSFELRREQMTMLLHAQHLDGVLDRSNAGREMFGPHPLFTSFEAVVRSETGDYAVADKLFAELAHLHVANFDMRLVRHLIRTGRPQSALPILDQWLDTAEGAMFWPYADAAWRMTGDQRADWLDCAGQLVGVYDLSDDLPSLDDLAACLRRLHIFEDQPLAQSVRGGTQTDGHLLQRIEPEIIMLREALHKAVEQHASNLPPLELDHPTAIGRPTKVAFSGAWSVRLQAQGRHSNHVHPMGWLSSALYIVLPPGVGDGESGWLTIGEPDASLATDLLPRRSIQPQRGYLALFPSWMWHGTRPFQEGERITVAFDVAPAPGSSSS